MRVRIKTRITNPKEIADQLRCLSCTEKQIARHLQPLMPTLTIRHQSAEPRPVLSTAAEALGNSSLLSPRFTDCGSSQHPARRRAY